MNNSMNSNLDYERRKSFGFFKVLAIYIGIILAGFVLSHLLMGCKHVKQYGPIVVKAVFDLSTNAVEKAGTSTNATGSVSTPAEGTDAVPFSSLVWEFGGLNAAGYPLGDARIENLKFGRNSLTFAFASGSCQQSFGASSKADTGKVRVCVFFKDAAGKWRGGKFDWYGDNRNGFRDLNHITGSTPYNGWSDSWIPNPAEGCFVLVGTNGKRSNVIAAEWRR